MTVATLNKTGVVYRYQVAVRICEYKHILAMLVHFQIYKYHLGRLLQTLINPNPSMDK